MPEETIESRLDAIEAQIRLAEEAVQRCRTDLEISGRIESANASRIEKLTQHVAELQRRTRSFPPNTDNDPIPPAETTIKPKPVPPTPNPTLPS